MNAKDRIDGPAKLDVLARTHTTDWRRKSAFPNRSSWVTRLRPNGGQVWYICDGLYSMLGDFAPFAA